MSMTTSVDIIIVNWNSGVQLRECLISIVATNRTGININLVVVDNASTDGSIEDLGDFDLPIKIIRNTENRGFASACNQGAKESVADYLLFLNPDTLLFSDSLLIPINFMEQAELRDVGACGIQLVNERGVIEKSCARFPDFWSIFIKILGLDRLCPQFFSSYFMNEWNHGENREVDHVTGAFMLIPRKIYELMGGFDERFFVYLEDVDMSYRINKIGMKNVYLATSQAFHKGGGTSEKIKATRLFYSLRSRILYGYKHFNFFAASILLLGVLLLEPFTRIGFAIIKRSFAQLRETLKGYAMLYGTLPTLLKICFR